MEAFDKFCIPRENTIVERHSFYKRQQQPGETVQQYVSSLRSLAVTCKFTDTDEMIRDRLCMGLSNPLMVTELLKHADLTLKGAVEIASIEEAVEMDQKMLCGQSEATICAVRPNQKWPNHEKRQNDPRKRHGETKPCTRCGYTVHKGPQCPALGKNVQQMWEKRALQLHVLH